LLRRRLGDLSRERIVRWAKNRLIASAAIHLLLSACGVERSHDSASRHDIVDRRLEPGGGGSMHSPEPPGPESETSPAGVELAEAAADLPSASGPPPSACPEDMALVEGNYCLVAIQRCLEHQDIVGDKGKVDANHCLKYQPSECALDRWRPMRYCMDRYEWPNKNGEKPRVLISWQQARDTCASVGKRLCTEDEFNFACEGEEMRPFVYGFERDATKCNMDRPYRPRTFAFHQWDACMAEPECKAAFDALDQRLPAGAMETCRSWSGIYDLNGNANEWVMRPAEKSPRRSGIKGGWWGPVRNRCRPLVTFHDEGDWGYEVGFRCCADAKE
jgi:hypothetical protein